MWIQGRTICTGKVDTVANVPSSSPQQRICCHTLADNLLRSNPDSILSSASFSCHSCCAHPFIFSTGGGATEMMGRWELIVSLSHLSLNSCHSMQLCPGTQLENLSDFTCGKNILHFKSIRKFEYPKQHFLIFCWIVSNKVSVEWMSNCQIVKLSNCQIASWQIVSSLQFNWVKWQPG